jgi:hypothetical protein
MRDEMMAQQAEPMTLRRRLRLWMRDHRPRLHMMPGFVTLYPIVQRAMHRVGLHKTIRIGPMIEDGTVIEKCNWCGISRVVTSHKMQRMAASLRPTD